MKDKYCKSNNIKLLPIPYWEFDKKETYKETINNFLKEIN
jgi:hypothetical protein